MKKLLASALALLMLLSLAACQQTPAPPSSGAEPGSSGESAPADGEAAVTYVELGDVLAAELYGIGFRSADAALGLEVQKHLDAMIEDGAAAAISEKWFGADVLLREQALLEETEAAADDASLQTVLDKGTLVVGLDDSYPPMGFRDDANEIVGFDIDLAREVATRMGVEVQFQPIAWDAKEMELDSGAIDCIWNGMTITDERLAGMFFARPYIANEQIIIVADNSGITEKAGLEGKIVGLQAGSSAVEALEADPIREAVAQVDQYDDNVAAFLDLQAGRIDALVVDSVVGRYILSQQNAA